MQDIEHDVAVGLVGFVEQLDRSSTWRPAPGKPSAASDERSRVASFDRFAALHRDVLSVAPIGEPRLSRRVRLAPR